MSDRNFQPVEIDMLDQKLSETAARKQIPTLSVAATGDPADGQIDRSSSAASKSRIIWRPHSRSLQLSNPLPFGISSSMPWSMPDLMFVPSIEKKMVDDYDNEFGAGAPAPEEAPTMLYAPKGAPSPSQKAPVSSHSGHDHSRGMIVGF